MTRQLVDLDYESIEHETEKAVLFLINKKKVWIPKSVAEVDFRGRVVTIPYRWAYENELI